MQKVVDLDWMSVDAVPADPRHWNMYIRYCCPVYLMRCSANLLQLVFCVLQGRADGVALCLAPPSMQLLPDTDSIMLSDPLSHNICQFCDANLLQLVLCMLQGGADGVALCLAPPGMQLLPDAGVISNPLSQNFCQFRDANLLQIVLCIIQAVLQGGADGVALCLARSTCSCCLTMPADAPWYFEAKPPCLCFHALQGGADGVALCLAPPGMQLLPDADVISDCPVGSYKEGWNLNPCASVSGGWL
jgi:hypothetical protein